MSVYRTEIISGIPYKIDSRIENGYHIETLNPFRFRDRTRQKLEGVLAKSLGLMGTSIGFLLGELLTSRRVERHFNNKTDS